MFSDKNFFFCPLTSFSLLTADFFYLFFFVGDKTFLLLFNFIQQAVGVPDDGLMFAIFPAGI